MKNKNLKFCFVIILSFAMCSLKAQSVLQKQQKDIEQRKKYRNEVLLKAKEQQVQQQAERTKEVPVQNNSSSGTTPQQHTQTVPAEQKSEIKPQAASPVRKQKQLTTQQRSPATKGNTEQ